MQLRQIEFASSRVEAQDQREGVIAISIAETQSAPRDFAFRRWNHVVHGNTWKVNEDGSWYLPEKTLGWQVAGWCSAYLLNDDGGQWRFTKEQLRFLLWWYAVDDRGKFIYRKGVLQRLK